ncbi:MAG: hypothetical protein R3A10_01535 [Caldilineaceae bacterium]
MALDHGEFDNWWRVFNRTFVLIYPSDRAAQVGHHGRSLRPQRHVAHRLDRLWRWRPPRPRRTIPSRGSTSAPAAVGAGDFTQAADAFDRARTLGLPWRMFWYQFGAFEAYWRTGRYEDVAALADATLAGGAAIESPLLAGHESAVLAGRQDRSPRRLADRAPTQPRFSARRPSPGR